MSIIPKVYADFQNADTNGRVRLVCNGALEDLAILRIELREGQQLRLYCEELEVDGTVHFSDDEQIWVASIDWSNMRGAHPDEK